MGKHEELEIDHAQLWATFCRRHPLQKQTIDDHEWCSISAGSGDQWVVLLPGALGVADTSFHYMLAFAEEYRVLSLDYPQTSGRLEPLLTGMAALLKAKTVGAVHLVGGSYSGPIAHAFAQRYPAQIRSLIFANTGLPQRRRLAVCRALSILLMVIPPVLLQLIMQWSIRWFLPAETALERFWRDYFTALLPHFRRHGLCNRVRIFMELALQGSGRSTWAGPVLIVDARRETFFTAQEQAALRTAYPQAEQLTIEMMGHGSALKALDAHIAAYAAFLERLPTK